MKELRRSTLMVTVVACLLSRLCDTHPVGGVSLYSASNGQGDLAFG